jgi:integrase
VARLVARRAGNPSAARAVSAIPCIIGAASAVSARGRGYGKEAVLRPIGGARSAEVLALNVEDLDLANGRAKVRCKGGAANVIVWQAGTARLLPRLLKGRRSGPLFVTERKTRVHLPVADLDEHGHARLSYQQTAGLFAEASGGVTLHQLRHSADPATYKIGAHPERCAPFTPARPGGASSGRR